MVRRRLLMLLGLGCFALLGTPSASAFWTASGTGGGSGQTGALTAPVAAATSPSPGTVTVTWTASTGTSGPVGYYVVRIDSGEAASPACGTSAGATSLLLTCTDLGMAAGSYTYKVTAVFRSWTATSAAVAVTVAPPASKLAFTTSPSNSTGGVAFATQPVVAIEDSTGAVVPSNTSAVTLTITGAPAGVTLTCGANPRTAVAGVATFSGCAIDKAGTYTLHATDGGLTAATSAAFTITVGTAAKLAFTTSPTDSFVNGVFFSQPVVTVQDAGGNTVTSATNAVTLTITTPAGAALTCTANPKAAVAGVATFAGCRINTVGTYTLTAAAMSVTTATSATFDVIAAPTNLAWTGYSSTCAGPSGMTPQFTLTYSLCLVGGTFISSVTLTDSSGTAVANVGAAVTVTLTGLHGTADPLTVVIPHSATVAGSSPAMTFTSGLHLLLPTILTDRVTATAPSLISAVTNLRTAV